MTEASPPAPRRWRVRLVDFLQLHDLDGERGRDLRRDVFENGALTTGYALMCLISAGIATLGLLQSSTAVVIGAMLVSPLMSPIAALGFGLATFDTQRLRASARVVAVGAAIGILTGLLVTWISPIDGITPEILARTEPTLLDLAVALLSGVAGGYAIVRQQGETAIGVAIATALMPPLATVGYGIAAWRADIAGGAMLLFLTNLAAIAIAIATVARLTGAAAPRAGLKVNPGVYVLALALTVALLTPLATTLLRLRQELDARTVTRRVLSQTFDVPAKDITQLDVSWPLGGSPMISAIVVAPRFQPEAQAQALAQIATKLGTTPKFNLQQLEIGSGTERSAALIAAALERSAAGNIRDEPPVAEIRATLGLPLMALWHDATTHVVQARVAAAPGWTLVDYRGLEPEGGRKYGTWTVHVIPPVQAVVRITADPARAAAETAATIWALQAWGLRRVVLRLPGGEDFAQYSTAPSVTTLVAALATAGVEARLAEGDAEQAGIEILTLPAPASAVRSAAAPAADIGPGQKSPARANPDRTSASDVIDQKRLNTAD
ncbi:MAG: DUF389 domain-containing protein [Polymorphobacter sp.]